MTLSPRTEIREILVVYIIYTPPKIKKFGVEKIYTIFGIFVKKSYYFYVK